MCATAPVELWCYLYSCGAFLWTCLHISEQLGQVKLPLLAEARELQQETDRVIGLIQTRQALHCSHCIQTLSRREKVNSSLVTKLFLILFFPVFVYKLSLLIVVFCSLVSIFSAFP